MKVKFFAPFILFSLLAALSFGQIALPTTSPESVGISSERLTRLNQQMHEFVDKGQLACIQTAIMRRGKLVHFDTYGKADLKSAKSLEDNSLWRIYSMTKPIVSVGLMMLYEEGKFQINDPVHWYIPALKDMTVYKDGKVVEAENDIRIVDLLRHTSGIGYGWGKGDLVDSLYKANGLLAATDLKDFIQRLQKTPLYFEPGTGWRYGMSVDVTGHLIEVLSGMPLDQYLSEKIFKPLKMEDTFFEVPAKKKDRFITNYSVNKEGELFPIDHPSRSNFTKKVTMFSGGGGLVSCAQDYLRFSQMLLNGGELDNKRLLSPKTIELMTVDHTKGISHQGGPVVVPSESSGFGLGFTVRTDLAASAKPGSVGTYGWSGLAGTYFRVDPKEDLIFLLMIQQIPHNHLRVSQKFHTMVYQSIIE